MLKLARKLGSIAIVAMIGIAVNANAEPTTFDWSSTTGFIFSRSQAAIEAVTGQTAFQAGPFFVVEGSMNGQFTYDPANAQDPQFFGNFAIYAGANVNANSSLFGNSGLIGSLSGGTGSVSISDNGGGPVQNDDVVNINHCCGADFQVGDWFATSASVVWVGDGFQDGPGLPPSLPPAGAPLPLGIFSFFNVVTGENVSILTQNVDVREAVQSVDIDVKPGRDPNVIDFDDDICGDDDDSRLKVAILTADEFDAVQVDASTVQIGDPALSGTAEPIRSRVRDIDGDGDADLLLKFSLCDLVTGDALNADTIEIVLTGEAFDGSQITGSDSVSVLRDDDNDDSDSDSVSVLRYDDDDDSDSDADSDSD